MGLVIRMRQQGRRNRHTFRLVVADKKTPRDGKYVEAVGSYDPHNSATTPQIEKEKIAYWLGQGAQITHAAQELVRSIAPEVIQLFQEKKNEKRAKLAAARSKRGERKKHHPN